MPQVKQASKQKRRTKAAVSALGAAGLTFSLLGSATASTVPTADVAQTTAFGAFGPNEAMTLSEEEIADTSLATFYVFDREKVGSGVQVARRGCGGCRGCAVRASGGGGGGGGCGACGCACHTAQL